MIPFIIVFICGAAFTLSVQSIIRGWNRKRGCGCGGSQ